MKPYSPATARAAPSLVKARNYALMNQLGTPGLGSLMGGRRWAGAGQLLLAVIGFLLVAGWFVQTVLVAYYGLMSDQRGEPKSYTPWGLAGAVIFIGSWFWALASSIGLYRQARAAQRSEYANPPAAPPTLQ